MAMSEKQPKAKKKKTQKPEEPKDLVKKEYTEEEKATIAAYVERSKRKPIKFKLVKDDLGSHRVVLQVPKGMLSRAGMAEAFGTPDTDLQDYLLNQVVNTFSGLLSSEGVNHDKAEEFPNNAMALLNGIQPQDEIEGMLALQMIAVHNMAMNATRVAMITGQPTEVVQVYVNQATKMLRTFTAQMEALKRYRTGGQQKVTVEHVYVGEGGQAIVGAVSTGGRGNCGKRE